MNIEKKCEICGKDFIAIRRNVYCCCKKCSEKRSRKRYQEGLKTKKEKMEMRKSHIDEKLKEARKQGKTYAQMQKEETTRLYARVIV